MPFSIMPKVMIQNVIQFHYPQKVFLIVKRTEYAVFYQLNKNDLLPNARFYNNFFMLWIRHGLYTHIIFTFFYIPFF